MKHFRATHKETGNVIEFGLEDVSIDIYDVGSPQCFLLNLEWPQKDYEDMREFLKEYDLEYNHKGEWFKYE